MPGAQQVTQMRQARPAGMQQQVRAVPMSSRPITGQQAVAVPPRAPGLSHLQYYIICTDPGKSRNVKFKFSTPGQSWNKS